MIYINFQGGSHGNYLEFVCNKMVGIAVGMPFNSHGASHNKTYTGKKIFQVNGYLPTPIEINKIINIYIDVNDLLPLQQISLLRTDDHGYDNDQLEIDTYNKLNNQSYSLMLDDLLQGFFTNQIQDSYNAVKDPSWPTVTTLSDFKNLPDWIKQECAEQHKLQLLELSPTQPDCPRSVLREFFQIGFQFPEHQRYISDQNQMKYDNSKQVYYFPFACFYSKNNFLKEIEQIASWANITYTCQHEVEQLHDEFLQRQYYIHSKIKCDNIVTQIQNKITPILKVDMLEEAYINAKLGWNYFT